MTDLGDTAVVVRGGTRLSVEKLREAITDAILDGDGPVWSVYCHDVTRDFDEMAAIQAAAARDPDPDVEGVRNRQIQVAHAGAIRALSLTLEWDPTDGQGMFHYHVVFPEQVTDSLLEGFVTLFQDMPNPVLQR